MEDYKCMVEPEITGEWYEEAKTKLSSVYGECVSYDHTLDDFERADEYLDELEREGDFR